MQVERMKEGLVPKTTAEHLGPPVGAESRVESVCLRLVIPY